MMITVPVYPLTWTQIGSQRFWRPLYSDKGWMTVLYCNVCNMLLYLVMFSKYHLKTKSPRQTFWFQQTCLTPQWCVIVIWLSGVRWVRYTLKIQGPVRFCAQGNIWSTIKAFGLCFSCYIVFLTISHFKFAMLYLVR